MDTKIDYALNLAKITVLNCSFNETKSSNENKKFICNLLCKTNLKEFEKQYFQFNQTFIKKHIANYLPVVYKVFAFVPEEIPEGCPMMPETMATAYVNGERGFYMLTAKYYMEPNKKARIMHFNNVYYQDYLRKAGMAPIEVDDMVDVKKLPFADKYFVADGYEKEVWEFCDTFTVRGSASCHEEDYFVEGKGKRVAMLRAMENAVSRMKNLTMELSEALTGIQDVANNPQNDFDSFYFYYNNRVKTQFLDMEEFDFVNNNEVKPIFKGNLKKYLQ